MIELTTSQNAEPIPTILATVTADETNIDIIVVDAGHDAHILPPGDAVTLLYTPGQIAVWALFDGLKYTVAYDAVPTP